MRDVNAILATAELGRERLAAVLRIVVFFSLLATALAIQHHGQHYDLVLGVSWLYGVLALIGIILAWMQVFHPIVLYVFVSLEVGLVLLQATLMATLMEQPLSAIAAMPIATIIFVVMVHAAMRYRPWLVVFAATFYLSGLFLAAVAAPGTLMSIDEIPWRANDFVHHQIVPIAVLVVTALILFITVHGTQKLLQTSIRERLARTRLSRFFSPDIADQLILDTSNASTEGRTMPVAVLFADIRGFSALAENMEPGALSTLLAEFREILSNAVQINGGVVDKFIGDAVLAVFGFPDTDNSPPDRALNSAQAILDGVSAWSYERNLAMLPSVEIGIGMHYGKAFVGVIGKESLLEFTVIGDTVNVAERVERLTRTLNANVVVSETLAQHAATPFGPEWSLEKECPLTGRNRPIAVYYLPRMVLDDKDDGTSCPSSITSSFQPSSDKLDFTP